MIFKQLTRNDLCWCGSGIKYKKCHMEQDERLKELKRQGVPVPSRNLIKTDEQIAGIRRSCQLSKKIMDLISDEERVKNVISECQEGVISAHYQTGHPHAYMNVMYMGELAVCRMLWDKQGNISALKRVVEKYPPKLKRAIIGFLIPLQKPQKYCKTAG
jgi:hypothetical protein